MNPLCSHQAHAAIFANACVSDLQLFDFPPLLTPPASTCSLLQLLFAFMPCCRCLAQQREQSKALLVVLLLLPVAPLLPLLP